MDTSSNCKITLIKEAIASISRCTGRFAREVITCRVFAIRGKLFRDINLATFIMIHHVAAIKCFISQFEALTATTSIKSILFFGSYFILREFGWGVSTGQCVDVWGKSFIDCVTLFAVEMVLFACKVLLLLPRFDTVQAAGRSWQRRDWRLEVALAAPRLAHLILAELSVFIQFKFVLLCPETVTYLGFTGPSEVSWGLKQICWVLLLLLPVHQWRSTNLLWWLRESVNAWGHASALRCGIRLQDGVHRTTFMIVLVLLFTTEATGFRSMHLVKAALATHRGGCDNMIPGPGIKRGGRSRRIKWIQSIVYRIYSVSLFSHFMKIAPELSVLVGCAQSMQIAGGLGGLPCRGDPTFSGCGRRYSCTSSTTSLHTLSVVVVEASVEGALIEHSSWGRGKSGVHGRRFVLNTHLTRVL